LSVVVVVLEDLPLCWLHRVEKMISCCDGMNWSESLDGDCDNRSLFVDMAQMEDLLAWVIIVVVLA
jgi:hypothetical protein